MNPNLTGLPAIVAPGLPILAGIIIGLAALWCAVNLVSIAYEARTAFRRDLLEQFTQRRLTLWPSTLTDEWIVETDSGIELGRARKWEMAVQEALLVLAIQKEAR